MNIPLFDGHCDTAFRLILEGGSLYENSLHTDLRRGLEYAPYAQFYALFSMDEDFMPAFFPKLKGKNADDIFRLEVDYFLKNLKRTLTGLLYAETLKTPKERI
jgi:hypothetical protein